MEYIMTALGVVIIMGLISIALMLAPVVFNLFVIGVDEFMKLCSWLRYRVKTRNLRTDNEVIIPQAEYDMLLETFNMYYDKEITEKLEEDNESAYDEESWNVQTKYAPTEQAISDNEMTQTYYYDVNDFEDVLKEDSLTTSDETNEEEIPLF